MFVYPRRAINGVVRTDWGSDGACISQFDGFQAARAGLKSGHAPKLASAGTGGSYFIAGADGKPVAVFKPLDEEPCAVNNPKVRPLTQSLLQCCLHLLFCRT